ncbi:MAG: hypothetical protein WC833_12865 [Bacteroidales bacterium]|jgi:hypothetical protein
MKTEKINKVLFWTVILLAILNITTLTTIFYGKYHKTTEDESIVINSENSPLNGRMFRENLNFDNEQMNKFREQSRDFRYKANEIIGNMNRLKGSLFNELQKPHPDRKRTREISDSIGIAHANLKEASVDFYLKLKECCNQDQNELLKNMFSPLFEERGHQNMGGRGGNGHKNGNGNGNRNRN